MQINNSTFERQEHLIVGMYTLYPELAPQYYTFVEPLGGGLMRSSKFTFDGQVFKRDKKHGGNLPSSWCISGKSLSKKELADKKHQDGFNAFMGGFFNMIQSDAVSTPVLITASDIKGISVRIRNDFK